MIRQLLIDCRDWIRGFYGDKPMELLARLDTALAEQCTAADEKAGMTIKTARCGEYLCSNEVVGVVGDVWYCRHHLMLKLFGEATPHPQVNEPPSSLTSGQNDDNSCYENECSTCRSRFVGHKRQVICHNCAYAAKHGVTVADQLAGGGK